ncbi:DUF423 domain-containing protein [Acidiluteibacter ferrifornacis]|uniref:DUF423 domain-containing protein n=1 Tax=Acidiluteibacter ferrifornacis TaxID=2692424 RepID=A0A6N9NKS2_9FLAO|nr:DUF423 domain-containing protein [Acidiluteibacter ferrifornacis]NBG65800.1 DUF423 domain-containing protein [Acidiluteibacter ferrifornacis]
MKNNATTFGAAFGLLAVILGAMGAHALKSELSIDQLESFQTGVRYQIYHAIMLFIIANRNNANSKLLNTVSTLFIIGIILFSFSIYLLSTRSITGIEGLSILGPITPIGGLFLISGWIMLLFGAIRKKI